MNPREEIDSIGRIEVPADALWGSNTARALRNFPLADRSIGEEPHLVRAMAAVKKACALANIERQALPQSIGDALVNACDEMAAGQLDRHLVVPLLEGSGGTSINMNVNEVLANRALQLIGSAAGDYSRIHPNDHANCGQSTNDVLPSALKLAGYSMAGDCVAAISALAESLQLKSQEFAGVYRLGRTCLQDAQPMSLGQAFEGYAAVVRRAALAIDCQRAQLLTIPLGGTAIGTGLGASPSFATAVIKHLRALTGEDVAASPSRFDGLQNLDALQRLSAELETACCAMAKIAKDFIILSSGPNGGLAEIALPALQPGSSIMPGKVNPVLPMAMVQLAQIVHGNHACIAMACQDGMLEINHYEPAIASRLFDSMNRIHELSLSFVERCVTGIVADADRSLANLMNSYALATTLVPELGYAAVSQLVKDSVADKRAFIELAEERGLLTREAALQLIESAVHCDSR